MKEIRCKKCGMIIGKRVISSVQIDSLMAAKMFSKKHKNVIRDIKSNRLKVEPITYTDKRNRKQKCYAITPEGFNFLANRYRSKQVDTSSYVEIKRGKYVAKIYGNEPIEIACPRCGEVTTYESQG